MLHVIPGLASRTGGPGFAVVESARALAECGVAATVFATDVAEAASARDHRRVSRAELPPGADEVDVRLFRARWPYRLTFSPELYRALVRETGRYDVVHIHSLFLFPQWAAFRNAKRRDVPYVVSPRGALDPWLRARGRVQKAIADVLWQRRMLEAAAALHVTSEDEARLIRDVAPHVPRVVVPNGIRWGDFQELPPGARFRERYLGGHDGRLVLNLGRIAAKKGLDLLIRAFAVVARELPDVRLAIVGPDDEGLTPRLVAVAQREGVGARVTFVGILTGEEKRAALAAADVWALPSHTENFGIAVAEALAAGRATVISPAVNIAPDVRAAGAGIVAELAPQAFGAAIAGLLADERRRGALGERAREFARRYDWSAVGPDLAAMYAGIADGGAVRRRELASVA